MRLNWLILIKFYLICSDCIGIDVGLVTRLLLLFDRLGSVRSGASHQSICYYQIQMLNRIVNLASIFTKKQISMESVSKVVKTKAELVSRKTLNHDTYVFTFRFDGPAIHFSIGNHFVIRQHIKTWEFPQGEEVHRKYTPISPCSQKETMDVLIKIYRPNVHPAFPNGGKMTPYIEAMKIGDKINVEGPHGRLSYKRGEVTIGGVTKQVKHIFLIAGGSGITPVYQVITEIARDVDDKTKLSLLFANKTQQDIVLRKELEELKGRVNLNFTIDKQKQGWNGFTGHVSKQMLEKIATLDDPDTLYCHCGPFLMNKKIREIFEQFPKSTLFKF